MVAQSCPALQFGKIAMIRFSQVSLIRGTKLLLEGADIALNPGERIGLIGANGSGKSSLFALLRGELHTDKGELDYPAQWRVAHVAQESLALDRPAVEYAIDGDSALRSLEAGLAAAEAEDRGALMGELHAALADAGLYTARARAPAVLHRPLQGQGHQGPAGAEPHEDAGENGAARAAARRGAVFVRVSRAAARPESAACSRRRGRRLPGKAGAEEHQAFAAGGATHRAARRQWRRQVDPDQDHRRSARAVARLGHLRQGARHRLLRAAPGRDAAQRRVAARAPGAPCAGCARAGAAQLSRQLQFPGRHGDRSGREIEAAEKVAQRSEEHTSELQSPVHLVCRLL